MPPTQSPPQATADVFVLRHGERVDETRGPEFDRWIQDTEEWRRFDPPLTTRGRAQAASAAAAFAVYTKGAGIRFDVIYCSPTQRCVSTAAAFSMALGVPIACVPALAECCAALRSWNPSAAARWPLVLTDAEFAALNPGATFLRREREAMPGPVFMDGTGKTGKTCAGDLAAVEMRKGAVVSRARVLLCSHREAIRDLASFRCGLPTRLKTAYCCIAQFRCARPGGVDEGWNYDGMFDPHPAAAHELPGGDGEDPAAAELDVSPMVKATGLMPPATTITTTMRSPAQEAAAAAAATGGPVGNQLAGLTDEARQAQMDGHNGSQG